MNATKKAQQFRMMACAAAIEAGARCRKLAVVGDCYCQHHLDHPPERPYQPNVVVVRVRVNQRWTKRLEEARVPWVQRDEERIREDHIREAQALGRDPFQFGKKMPASGVPVFGKDGAKFTCMAHLVNDLIAVGFNPTTVHLFQKEGEEGGPMANFCLTLSLGGEFEVGEEILSLVDSLLDSSFEAIHVWANPPDKDGATLNALVAVHRLPDQSPKRELVYDDGRWGLEELES